jgi:hypothetical protein
MTSLLSSRFLDDFHIIANIAIALKEGFCQYDVRGGRRGRLGGMAVKMQTAAHLACRRCLGKRSSSPALVDSSFLP